MATTKKTLAVVAEQTTNPDGSITIRALELADGRDIGTKAAAKLLGTGPDLIYVLCTIGELKAWKTASARGNAPWRISLQSVIDYKERRIAAVMGAADN
jgi:hypothetical protein